jgi:hypothetical protein
MRSEKEKRTIERINLANVNGSVELKDTVKTIAILNACEEGVCIEGAGFPVGSVVRLAINHPEDSEDISLYCKVVWSSNDLDPDKKAGLLFLNTNKILFKQDLISFNKLIASAKKRLNQ